jgi:hypothetical protein
VKAQRRTLYIVESERWRAKMIMGEKKRITNRGQGTGIRKFTGYRRWVQRGAGYNAGCKDIAAEHSGFK